jgi:hypothetical protein
MPGPAPDEERNAAIYRLRVVNRLTFSEIGERYGISYQRAWQIVQDYAAALPPIDAEAMRRRSLELHEAAQRMAMELAEREGAPVYVGKDGALAYDDAGQLVRDYSLRLSALETMRKADVEIRKLHGLDAATKQEISGSVRYEVAGVDLDALK